MNALHAGPFYIFVSSADNFKNKFKKFLQECNQSVQQFGSRSGPIWVDTACEGYQQAILSGDE